MRENVSVCITGSRPQGLIGGYDLEHPENIKIKEDMKVIIKNLMEFKTKNLVCYTGMALGIDIIFADAVLDMKDTYGERIKLICALPFKNQTANWKGTVDFYNLILEYADEVINTSGEEDYKAWYMEQRNRFMVDKSDMVIAYWAGKSKGTGNCVQYAKNKNKPILFREVGLII